MTYFFLTGSRCVTVCVYLYVCMCVGMWELRGVGLCRENKDEKIWMGG